MKIPILGQIFMIFQVARHPELVQTLKISLPRGKVK